MTRDGKAVLSMNDVKAGDQLVTRVKNGTVRSEVI
jgi:hypothetical protein